MGAAEGGHTNLLLWLREIGCTLCEYATDGAALSGHIDVLHFLLEKICPWNTCTCDSAASREYLKS